MTASELFSSIQRRFADGNYGHMPQYGYPEGSPAGGEFVFALGTNSDG